MKFSDKHVARLQDIKEQMEKTQEEIDTMAASYSNCEDKDFALRTVEKLEAVIGSLVEFT